MTNYNNFLNEIRATHTASVMRAYKITSELLVGDNFNDDEDYEMRSKYEDAVNLLNLVLECNLNGDADDFHNYALVFVEIDYFDQAIKVLETGLNRFSCNTDLLADYLKYLPSSSDINWKEKCSSTFSQLKSIPKYLWTWRAYHFSIEYMLKLIDENQLSAKDLKSACLKLAREFKKACPYDEKPYLAEASVRLSFKEECLAISCWQNALEMDGLRCPRCAMSIAEHAFYLKDYDKALTYLKRAEADSIDMRGSMDLAWVYYCRMLSQISCYIIGLQNSEEYNDELNRQLVKDIYSNYHIILKLWKNRKDKLKEIKCYIDLIKLKSNIDEEYDEE